MHGRNEAVLDTKFEHLTTLRDADLVTIHAGASDNGHHDNEWGELCRNIAAEAEQELYTRGKA